ncbi:MAG: hypothetical protein HQ526_07395 [Actinobacteria bacterium]|nr:hypothetical protein [Actinomycetota bacterium]
MRPRHLYGQDAPITPNKHYTLNSEEPGMVVADNGSDWFFQGTSDSRWPSGIISELKGVPASGFEAVDTSPLQISANSGRARR